MERVQGGKKIIGHQHVAIKIAEMKVKIEALRTLIWKCSWCWDNKYDYDPKMGMLIKALTDETAVFVVNAAVDIFGGVATGDRDLPDPEIYERYLYDSARVCHYACSLVDRRTLGRLEDNCGTGRRWLTCI